MYDGLNLISLHELEDRRRCRSCLIIDLREPELFRMDHFPGAVNLPFEDFDRWAYRLPKHKTIILYCERGGSAMQAGRRLMRAGYRVEVVSGGYRSIQQRGQMDESGKHTDGASRRQEINLNKEPE